MSIRVGLLVSVDDPWANPGNGIVREIDRSGNVLVEMQTGRSAGKTEWFLAPFVSRVSQ